MELKSPPRVITLQRGCKRIWASEQHMKQSFGYCSWTLSDITEGAIYYFNFENCCNTGPEVLVNALAKNVGMGKRICTSQPYAV